jgi:hypothetical protein
MRAERVRDRRGLDRPGLLGGSGPELDRRVVAEIRFNTLFKPGRDPGCLRSARLRKERSSALRPRPRRHQSEILIADAVARNQLQRVTVLFRLPDDQSCLLAVAAIDEQGQSTTKTPSAAAAPITATCSSASIVPSTMPSGWSAIAWLMASARRDTAPGHR